MPQYRPTDQDFVPVRFGERTLQALKADVFECFRPTILGLGDVSLPSRPVQAICAMLDLEGFTAFCEQRDPQLVVPGFLSAFLEWVFAAIRRETTRDVVDGAHVIWHALPWCAKFTGDGLMLLWDTEDMTAIGQNNLVASMSELTLRYEREFVPDLRSRVPAAPRALRCGMAKGTVYTVGEGDDCVGACINLAARLQKLPGVRAIAAQHGFDLERHLRRTTADLWTVRQVAVRGLGRTELVLLPKADLERMTPDERALYHEP